MKFTLVRSDKGFTIVELMVALSIFSVILVIGTVLMIQIGSLYTKGVNSATLQNTTRDIKTDVSSTIEFGGVRPYGCTVTAVTCYANSQNYGGVTVYAFCIDTTRYSYVMGRELGNDQGTSPIMVTPHVLWRDKMTSGATCQPLDLTQSGTPSDGVTTGDGYEMVPQHVRLNRFRVAESPANSGLYATDVWAGFGDSDLLMTDSVGHSRCTGGDGTQFCAVSELSSLVVRRVQ